MSKPREVVAGPTSANDENEAVKAAAIQDAEWHKKQKAGVAKPKSKDQGS